RPLRKASQNILVKTKKQARWRIPTRSCLGCHLRVTALFFSGFPSKADHPVLLGSKAGIPLVSLLYLIYVIALIPPFDIFEDVIFFLVERIIPTAQTLIQFSAKSCFKLI